MSGDERVEICADIVVGQRVRFWRVYREMTMQAVAKSFYMDPLVLQDIENGRVRAEIDLLLGLASLFLVKVDAFFMASIPYDYLDLGTVKLDGQELLDTLEDWEIPEGVVSLRQRRHLKDGTA
jgi:transcriptional regulator with XRE-family HTH domain